MPRKKLKKFEEIKEMGNVFEESFEKGFFGNENALILEMGCGHGQYILELSGKYPEKNFVGIDKKADRIWSGAKKALELNRGNAAFLKCFGENIGEYFGENSVDEIWVTFPDPFPKPSKANKRLVSPRLLEIYRRILKKGGKVHLKTDHSGLFIFAKESAEDCGWEIEEEISDLHAESELSEELKIRTFYEEKFIGEGKEICYLRILNK